MSYKGAHLIIDLWGAIRLDDIDYTKHVVNECVVAAGGTLLHLAAHDFGKNMGVSVIALLAESHITIHTWPEDDYAAVDIFVCGTMKLEQARRTLETMFKPSRIKVIKHQRGALGDAQLY